MPFTPIFSSAELLGRLDQDSAGRLSDAIPRQSTRRSLPSQYAVTGATYRN